MAGDSDKEGKRFGGRFHMRIEEGPFELAQLGPRQRASAILT